MSSSSTRYNDQHSDNHQATRHNLAIIPYFPRYNVIANAQTNNLQLAQYFSACLCYILLTNPQDPPSPLYNLYVAISSTTIGGGNITHTDNLSYSANAETNITPSQLTETLASDNEFRQLPGGAKTEQAALDKIKKLVTNPSINQECQAFLDNYRQEKEWTEANFIEGVKQFAEKANFSAEDREQFYGNRFYGVHYLDDFVQLWNQQYGIKLSNTNLISQQINPSHTGWDFVIEDGFQCLVYKGKGDNLAKALDSLFQGPTFIDCGMFCQLALWFGIRYVLGDDQFNQAFGHSPFYITQLMYQSISNSKKPHQGNPLFEFMTTDTSEQVETKVRIKHMANHKLYLVRHPAGSYQGHNCLVTHDSYAVFDPLAGQATNLSREDVKNQLVEAFNKPQDGDDRQHLKYLSQTPEKLHSELEIPHSEVVSLADQFKDKTISKNDLPDESFTPNSMPQVSFDFGKFKQWCQKILTADQSVSSPNYHVLSENQLAPDPELLNKIPDENKTINFEHFYTSKDPNRFIEVGKKFCDSVARQQSALVILSGQAGIGKTASATCCAKELSSRGYQVVWLSEVALRAGMDKMTFDQIGQCRQDLQAQLANNIDAVFLDDNNLTGYAGSMLLEEVYDWYCRNPAKGLFISSNEEISFEELYRRSFLDTRYNFPPFPGYYSPQHANTYIQSRLQAPSLRQVRANQTLATIVDDDTYQRMAYPTDDVEYIPAFSERRIDSINADYQRYGAASPKYKAITEHEWKWLKSRPNVYYKLFDKTDKSIIALEMVEGGFDRPELAGCSIDQLRKLITYGHETPDKCIVLINKTDWTKQVLLEQIEKQIPQAEKERTMSRFNTMLARPEDILTFQNTISDQSQVSTQSQNISTNEEDKTIQDRFKEALQSESLKDILEKIQPSSQVQANARSGAFARSSHTLFSSSSLKQHQVFKAINLFFDATANLDNGFDKIVDQFVDVIKAIAQNRDESKPLHGWTATLNRFYNKVGKNGALQPLKDQLKDTVRPNKFWPGPDDAIDEDKFEQLREQLLPSRQQSESYALQGPSMTGRAVPLK